MAKWQELMMELQLAFKVASSGIPLNMETFKILMDPTVRPSLKRVIREYDFDEQRLDTFGGP